MVLRQHFFLFPWEQWTVLHAVILMPFEKKVKTYHAIFFMLASRQDVLFSHSTSNFFHNGNLLQVIYMNKFPLEDQIQGCQIQALSLLPSAQHPRVDIQLLLKSILILPHSKSQKKISHEKIFLFLSGPPEQQAVMATTIPCRSP